MAAKTDGHGEGTLLEHRDSGPDAPSSAPGETCDQLALFREQARESARMAEALNGVNDIIHSSLDPEQILQQVVERSRSAFDVDAAFILVREGDHLTLGYASGLPEGAIGITSGVADCPAFERATSTRQPLVFSELVSDEPTSPTFALRLGAVSTLYAPLIVRGEGIGILSLCYLHAPREFSSTQIDNARKLATSVGLALENARLYKTEHDIAQLLQRALIDMRTNVRDLDIAFVYRSADAMDGSVGGDFCDVFEIDENLVGMLVGDVSGKGIGAAVLTSLLKNSIGAYAMDGAGAALALEKANRIAASRTDTWIFATVFLVVLDRSTGEMRYSGAGHPPLLVRGSDGLVRQLPSGGPILGAFETATFTQGTLMLDPGDTLVFYTDGIIEARTGSDMYGTARLVHTVEVAPPRPADMVTAVIDDVSTFAGGPLRDDAVVLVVGFVPEHR